MFKRIAFIPINPNAKKNLLKWIENVFSSNTSIHFDMSRNKCF